MTERRNIFSWRREQCSTTPRRLVLIKLPLMPLATPAPPPLCSPQGNETRGLLQQNGAKI